MASTNEHLRANLRTARRRAGLSQDEVARRLGVSRSTVVNYENGGTDPGIDRLESLARLYAMPVAALFTAGGSLGPTPGELARSALLALSGGPDPDDVPASLEDRVRGLERRYVALAEAVARIADRNRRGSG